MGETSSRVIIEIFAKDLANGVIGGVKSALESLQSAVTALAQGIAAAGVALLAFTRFSVEGEQAIAVSSRFTGEMDRLGLSADVVRDRIEAATGGLVTHENQMRLTTNALALGKFNLDQTALAMEFFRLRAISTGQDVTSFTEQGIYALSAGLTRGLMPVFPDLNRQLEQLANSGFSHARERSELLRLVFGRMQQDLPQLRAEIGNTTDSAQRFAVNLKDSLTQLAAEVAQQPATQQFFAQITNALQQLIAKLPQIIPTLTQVIQAVATIAGIVINEIVVPAAQGIAALADLTNELPQSIQASGLAANIAGSMQIYDQLNPDKNTAARVAWTDLRTRISTDLNDLALQVMNGGKLQGLTREQLALVSKAVDEFNLDPKGGLLGGILGVEPPQSVVDQFVTHLRTAISTARAALGPETAAAVGTAAPGVLHTKDIIPAGTKTDVNDLQNQFEDLNVSMVLGNRTAQDYATRLNDVDGALRTLIRSGQLDQQDQTLAVGLLQQVDAAREKATKDILDQADALLTAAERQKEIALQAKEINIGGQVSHVGTEMGKLKAETDALENASQLWLAGLGSITDVSVAADTLQNHMKALRDALKDSGIPADQLGKLLEPILQQMQKLGLISDATKKQLDDALNRGKAAALDLNTVLKDMTQNTLTQLGTVVEGVFEAWVNHSESAGKAFTVSMLKAIGAVAGALGNLLLVEAAKDFGKALEPTPESGNWVAAGLKLTAAAFAAFALAGALGGAAANSGGGGGGGGGGATQQSSVLSSLQQGSLTIVLPNGFINASDPDQLDALVNAFEQAGNKRVTVQSGASAVFVGT